MAYLFSILPFCCFIYQMIINIALFGRQVFENYVLEAVLCCSLLNNVENFGSINWSEAWNDFFPFQMESNEEELCFSIRIIRKPIFNIMSCYTPFVIEVQWASNCHFFNLIISNASRSWKREVILFEENAIFVNFASIIKIKDFDILVGHLYDLFFIISKIRQFPFTKSMDNKFWQK